MTETRTGVVTAWRGTFRDAGLRRLMGMSFVYSMGTALYVAGSVVYFTQKVGLSAVQAGTGLSAAAAVGLAGVLPVSWAAQRFGTWNVMVLLNLWRAGALTCFPFVHTFPAFLVAVSLLGIPEQAFYPLTQHFVELLVGPDERVRTMGKIRSVFNIGFTVGAPLSGVAAAVGTTAGYNAMVLGDALAYLVVVGFLLGFRGPVREHPRRRQDRKPEQKRMSFAPLRNRRYRHYAALNGVLTLHTSILTVGLPLWVVLHSRVPKYWVGPLLMLNTVLVVVFQVAVNARASSVPAALGLLRLSGFGLAGCCALLAGVSHLATVPALVILAGAVALLTAAEIAQTAGGFRLAYDLAPQEARQEWLATFWLGVSAQYVVGPVLLGDVVVARGAAGWEVLAVAFAAFAAGTGFPIRKG